jgi:hypothetical protein
VRLKIKPIWGYGWSNATRAFEIPARFDLKITATLPDGNGRLLAALGQVDQPEHQLAGFWVLLTARHIEDSGYYYLEAFAQKPDLAECVVDRSNLALPKTTGFVFIEERSL